MKTAGILFLTLIVFIQLRAQTFDPQPSIFGQGTISSKDFEFNAAFTPDGKTVYFTKALLPDFRRMSIVYSTFDGRKWGKPKLADFSGQYRDADPVITADGKRLIFISDRPSPIEKKPGTYNLWFVEKTAKGWSEPKHLSGAFYKETPSPVYPAVSRNGNIYYSFSNAQDSDIYVIRRENDTYGSPEKLNFNSPTQRDLDPAIAPDESFIVFTSPTRKGMGGNDLWVSFNENGKWSEPVNLGKTINSFSNEGQASISPDGLKLYFTSLKNADALPGQRDNRITQSTFEKEFDTIFNGLPNIWEVDISNINLLK